MHTHRAMRNFKATQPCGSLASAEPVPPKAQQQTVGGTKDMQQQHQQQAHVHTNDTAKLPPLPL